MADAVTLKEGDIVEVDGGLTYVVGRVKKVGGKAYDRYQVRLDAKFVHSLKLNIRQDKS